MDYINMPALFARKEQPYSIVFSDPVTIHGRLYLVYHYRDADNANCYACSTYLKQKDGGSHILFFKWKTDDLLLGYKLPDILNNTELEPWKEKQALA
jgi:hypothetical protein